MNRPKPESVPDKRPDLVVAVYGSGRTEVRLRGSNDVLLGEMNLAATALRLMNMFPDGYHLDVRYDPHM